MNRRIVPKKASVLLGLLLAVTGPATAIAGTAEFNFNTDPTGDLTIYGNNPEVWRSSGGNPGGYLSITDSVNGQNSVIVFDDFDNNAVVKAFTFSADVRMGNPVGNDGRPADGFSISYARTGDPVIATGSGFAGDNLPEAGTTTGIAIGFDTWAGNTLPDGPDIEGIIVRVDNVTVLRHPMPTRNGTCTDATSLQTGPYNADLFGEPDELCWAPVEVVLDEEGRLTVRYKGATLLDQAQTDFFPSAGRLILAGRTGGANQNHHIDNIRITTVPADTLIVGGVASTPTGFTVRIADSGPAVADPATIALNFNGVAVTPTRVTKTGTETVVEYSNPAAPLVSGSTQMLTVTVRDTRGVAVTTERTFTVAPYVTIPPAFAVQGVNTSAPGFLVRIHQVDTAQPNTIARAERQLAGLVGDNIWDQSMFTVNGYYAETGVINYNQDAPANAGNFNADTGHEDAQFPGQFDFDPNNMAAEILTYLHFPVAGSYTLIFNSDDGFRTTAHTNPREQLNSVIVSQFDDGRGATDTAATVFVAEAGFYPFRTVWFEGAGGANMEWVAITPDGTRALINDPGTPGSLKAYRTRTGAAPAAVTFVNPVRGSGNPYQPLTPVRMQIQDGASAVDQASIQLQLNGQAVTPTITRAGTTTTVLFTPTTAYAAGSTNTVAVSFTAGAEQYSGSYQFVASNYATLPPSMALPEAQVNRNNPGFLVRTVQTDFPLEGALDNTIYRAETQLGGYIGLPNTADLTGFGADGYYRESTVINYLGSGGVGQFPDVLPVPGIPGSAQFEAGGGNYSQEILTVIEFPAAGLYQMNVNSDDGFQVSVGNPRDAIRLVLGSFDGGRGVNGGTTFSFLVTQPGLYPFRTIWFEGGGGDAVEWSSITSAGERILVNDTVTPGHLKAFQYPITSAGAPYIENFAPARADRGNRAGINAAVTATLVDGVVPVDPATVSLSVGGTQVQPTVNKTGNRTTVSYQPSTAFATGSRHPVELTFNGRTVNWTFQVGTLPRATFFIEAEDFNYGGGQTRAEASQMPYRGGAYAGLTATLGVDYQRPEEPSSPLYRTGEINNVPMDRSNDRDRSGVEVVVNYKLGWVGEGHWYNYTRTFPQGDYNVYAGLSHGESNPDQLRGTLQRVTAGVTTASQTLEQLGSFNAPGTGGWGNNALVPLRNAEGANVVLALSGDTSLRYTTGSGDFDFILFVPAGDGTVDPNQPVLSVARTADNITITWEGEGILEEAESLTGPWTAVLATGNSYSTAMTGTQRFYRVRR